MSSMSGLRIATWSVASAAVGVLIANRQPRNRIAWILLLGAFVLTMQAPMALILSKGWTLQMERAMWPLLYAWPIAVAFVFPNGHVLSPRWRWVAGAAVAAYASFIRLGIFDPEPFYGEEASLPNPMAGNRFGESVVGIGLWVPLSLCAVRGTAGRRVEVPHRG